MRGARWAGGDRRGGDFEKAAAQRSRSEKAVARRCPPPPAKSLAHDGLRSAWRRGTARSSVASQHGSSKWWALARGSPRMAKNAPLNQRAYGAREVVSRPPRARPSHGASNEREVRFVGVRAFLGEMPSSEHPTPLNLGETVG